MREEQDLAWSDVLSEEKQAPYFRQILAQVQAERDAGQTIFPAREQVFNAMKLTELGAVKVVILGQDPYHGPNQAHGLCFSVQRGVQPPPSLQNIFKELASDVGFDHPGHGDLTSWAEQGVLLLNAALTVRAGEPQSHARLGWYRFTDTVIKTVNDYRRGVVFLLWGGSARKKKALIDRDRHHVLEAPHPSPLSAHRGFFGCQHFSRANHLLEQQGLNAIDWQLPS